MDVYELLHEDHEKVSELFKEISNTTSDDQRTREKFFAKVKQELEAHTDAEEKLFYPRLEEHEETRDLAKQGIDEHGTISNLLNEMANMDCTSEDWMQKCQTLEKNVENHVDKEENQMFPKARDFLSDGPAQELAGQVKKVEEADKA
jgi:hemerythrin superfamily protein